MQRFSGIQTAGSDDGGDAEDEDDDDGANADADDP